MANAQYTRDALTVTELNTLVHDVLESNDIFSQIAVRGELSNFVLGVVFVLPAAMIYAHNKTKKNAVIGLVTGGLGMVVLGCFVNAFVMLPLYSRLMPIEAILGQAAEIWPVIDNVFLFVLLCVAPFNLIKATLVSVVTMLLYKRLSPLLKGKQL